MKKTKKEGDGIKKPSSAYIYFVSDYRMVLKKKGVDTSKVQEVAKQCGAAWKAMTDAEKAPYNEKYKEDRARYLKEVKNTFGSLFRGYQKVDLVASWHSLKL